MDFNKYFETTHSNLIGVYNSGPIKQLFNQLRNSDSYFVVASSATTTSIEITYRREMTAEDLKIFVEIIGNYRESVYHDLKIRSIGVDFVVDGEFTALRNIANCDILLQFMISLTNILSGQPSQEDWDMQAIFNEDFNNMYTNGDSFSSIMSKLNTLGQIQLLGFKFLIEGKKALVNTLINSDLESLADEVYEYDYNDLVEYDYAKYGEPIIGFDPMSFYVQRANERQTQREQANERDLEERFGRGLSNYASSKNFNVDLYKNLNNIKTKFFKFKQDLIKLNK